ncbi:serine/threonine-protein kinase RIO1 [Nonomuraea thailandensis]|uniref:Serine/threonine-protein kinase RIO1 n=1 Tax=Nonomuraea thailandensis TaxID=1188745 RepID=A0A9X2GHV6_9ACTN|nr:hypothetical protein [Nonomuraea thailandensis]MCP2359354.1 serine/threonine-protein kinase RIO1 [Nonomuraea thailandensis]
MPGTDRVCLPAAERYRSAEHRLFHRDAGYLEGRRTRDDRMNRAVAGRTAFGKQVIAAQRAVAEFSALRRLGELECRCRTRVQIVGTEILHEFAGTPGGYAAPRLAQADEGPGAFLDRDARNVATWFAAKGVTDADPDALATLLREEAGLLP